MSRKPRLSYNQRVRFAQFGVPRLIKYIQVLQTERTALLLQDLPIPLVKQYRLQYLLELCQQRGINPKFYPPRTEETEKCVQHKSLKP